MRGLNTAVGQPDTSQAPAPARPENMITHFHHNQGPVCPVRPIPTDAGAYDNEDPSCEWCANYLRAARRNTARMHPQAAPPPPPAPTKDEG